MFPFFTGFFRRLYWRYFRPEIHGVACLIECEASILMIKHSLSRRSAWTLPSGNIQKGELPLDAVVRASWDQVGIRVDEAKEIDTIFSSRTDKHDALHCFLIHVEDLDFEVHDDLVEDVKWFPVNHLPRRLSLIARAAIDRMRFEVLSEACEDDPGEGVCRIA